LIAYQSAGRLDHAIRSKGMTQMVEEEKHLDNGKRNKVPDKPNYMRLAFPLWIRTRPLQTVQEYAAAPPGRNMEHSVFLLYFREVFFLSILCQLSAVNH